MLRGCVLLLVLSCGSSPAPAPKPPDPVEPAPRPEPQSITPPVTSSGSVGTGTRCDDFETSDFSIDGLLDDWRDNHVLAQTPGAPDGAVELRCAHDDHAIAIALLVTDDRVVRVRGKGHEDHVDISLGALRIASFPGNTIAQPKHTKPPKVTVADSLQPKGFSLELLVPVTAIPGFSASQSSIAFHAVFHDSDQATGGADHDVDLTTTIEFGDAKDLLDDFLSAVNLRRTDITLDTLVDIDPDRAGKERLVAGGSVIGVLTDRYGYVTLPANPTKIQTLPLGPKGLQVVAAELRQSGNGGSRDVLMLWTVWSGQLSPLVTIETRKEQGGNRLETEWKIAKGKKGPELVVTPKPAVGWTADTWNEIPAPDADAILLPWDEAKSGIAYSLDGAEITRRDLPPAKKRK